ncbi:hypothetical protein ACFC6L_10875 [Kitasatospora phosalacinea]|uniref:hypothetical protein n=1 Tax=Kitasatospora phosalacinea TaxID=2065 RepID=UPI0035DFB5C9
MSSLVQGDPVRHRTAGWTGIVSPTPSNFTGRVWVDRDSSAAEYPELVLLTDLEEAS